MYVCTCNSVVEGFKAFLKYNRNLVISYLGKNGFLNKSCFRTYGRYLLLKAFKCP